MPPISDNPVFMISAITILFAFLKVVASILYKSKCEQYSFCCGLFTATRNINAEVLIDQAELALQQQQGHHPPDPEAPP